RLRSEGRRFIVEYEASTVAEDAQGNKLVLATTLPPVEGVTLDRKGKSRWRRKTQFDRRLSALVAASGSARRHLLVHALEVPRRHVADPLDPGLDHEAFALVLEPIGVRDRAAARALAVELELVTLPPAGHDLGAG